MNNMTVYFILMPPVCAVLTGTVVWAANRNYALEDGKLIRQFLLVLAMLLSVAWAVSQTTTVRLRLDPQFKLQTELDAHPVYATIRRLNPDDHQKLLALLALQIAQGRTLSDAFLQARPLLTDMARNRLGWADQKTTLAWAGVMTETLRELQAHDPLLCYQAMSRQAPLPQAALVALSAANSSAFQRSVVDMYESSDRGIRQQGTPGEQRVEFNDAAREFSVVKDSVAQQFGEPIANLLARKSFTELTTEAQRPVCAAMIFQLEAMQARPLPMASTLLKSVLR